MPAPGTGCLAFKRKHHPSAEPLARGLRRGQMAGSQHLRLYHFNRRTAFCKWVACSLGCSVGMQLMLRGLLGKTCRQTVCCCWRFSLLGAVPCAAYTLPLRQVVRLVCQSRLWLCTCCCGTVVPVAARMARRHRSAARTTAKQGRRKAASSALGMRKTCGILESHLPCGAKG